MSKFSVSYNHRTDYENRVEINVDLQTRPNKTDYQSILEAIETLNTIAQKYIKIPKEEKQSEKATAK